MLSWIVTWKKVKLNPYLSYTRINFEWLTDHMLEREREGKKEREGGKEEEREEGRKKGRGKKEGRNHISSRKNVGKFPYNLSVGKAF